MGHSGAILRLGFEVLVLIGIRVRGFGPFLGLGFEVLGRSGIRVRGFGANWD